MATLIDLGIQHQELEKQIEEIAEDSMGELTEELTQACDELVKLEFEESQKLDGYGYVIRRLQKEAEIMAERAKEFARKKKVAENAIERMKERAKYFMQAIEVAKIEGDFTFAIQKNGGVLPLLLTFDSIKEVPRPFVLSTPSVDKDKVRAALDDGAELDFAHLGERGTSLRIR